MTTMEVVYDNEALKRARSWLLNNKPRSESFALPHWDHPFLAERNATCIDFTCCLEVKDEDHPGVQKISEMLFAAWLNEGKSTAVDAGFVIPDDPSGKGYKINSVRDASTRSTLCSLQVHLYKVNNEDDK